MRRRGHIAKGRMQARFGTALCVVCAIVFCAFVCACSSNQNISSYSLKTPGTLTVLTSADFPPMEYQEDGEIVGLDPAIAREFARRLDLDVSFENMDFTDLLSALYDDHEGDVVIAALSVRDYRKNLVDFSNPYYSTNQAILVQVGSDYKERSDLNKADVKVGVQTASTGETWAKRHLKKAQLVSFTDTASMIDALHNKEVQALIFDSTAARAHAAMDAGNCDVLETIYTGEQYAIAVAKGHETLLAGINEVLADMQSDGTMDRLIEDTFG